MLIKDLIQQVAILWPEYRSKMRVSKSEPAYDLVVNQLPVAIQAYIQDHENIRVEGSTGAGNITAAPWVALFDRRITDSASLGYYIVYLFSTDMSLITLCLAFGTTQFEKQFGGPSLAFPRMRFAASRLQDMFSHLIPEHMARGSIDLKAEPSQKLHYAYQQSTILSFAPYPVRDLPEESKLVADLRELVDIYTEIASDPLDVTVDRLVEAAVEPVAEVEADVREFGLRQPAAKRTLSGREAGERRYSPESRKVGDAGERIVLRYERDRLIKLGREDLADRVRWHGPEREFLGWDITSFDDGGDQFFIEVKSSIGQLFAVCLTAKEWQAASRPSCRDRYYIYLVSNALSSTPRIERMHNPAAFVERGEISCEPIVYELGLRTLAD